MYIQCPGLSSTNCKGAPLPIKVAITNKFIEERPDCDNTQYCSHLQTEFGQYFLQSHHLWLKVPSWFYCCKLATWRLSDHFVLSNDQWSRPVRRKTHVFTQMSHDQQVLSPWRRKGMLAPQLTLCLSVTQMTKLASTRCVGFQSVRRFLLALPERNRNPGALEPWNLGTCCWVAKLGKGKYTW